MNRPIPTLFPTLVVTSLALFGLAGPAVAADNETVMVPMVYNEAEGGYFQRDAAQILPCNAPSTPFVGDRDDPVIEGVNAEGEVLFEQRLRDPRLKLVEDPTPENPSEYVSNVDFVLLMPWTDEYTRVWFYGQLDQAEPSASVNLDNAIAAYREAGGRDQEADCKELDRLAAEMESKDWDFYIDLVPDNG